MTNPEPGGGPVEGGRRPTRGGRHQPPSGRWSAPELVVVFVAVALTLLLTFPLFAVANRGTPIILGMPLSMFWVVAWIVVEFVALLSTYLWDSRRDRR